MNRDQIQPRVPGTEWLPPSKRPKGTGYTNFQPAENRKAARKRRGATAENGMRKNTGRVK